jgi:hypothetical protein
MQNKILFRIFRISVLLQNFFSIVMYINLMSRSMSSSRPGSGVPFGGSSNGLRGSYKIVYRFYKIDIFIFTL